MGEGSHEYSVVYTGADEVDLRNHTQRKSPRQTRGTLLNLDLLRSAFTTLGPSTDLTSDVAVPQINLSFSDLSYSVKRGIKRETKWILKNLYGEFRSGELTAVMGPSGAGKSSLMNVLAGFTTYGVTGTICTNDVEREVRQFARQSCCIFQDDALYSLITVHEAMMVAAHLKLGSTVRGKNETVNKILESLGLFVSRNVLAGKLSGGQKKRLSIALEMVSNPPVMFFDEPTSGLDSSSSKQCVSFLHELARSGRTVVCTIHQPSASVLEMFDHMYVIKDGLCMYSGGTKGLVPFLAQQGLHCPQYHNPADFLLEVASMSIYSKDVPELIAATDQGRCLSWRKAIRKPTYLEPTSSLSMISKNNVAKVTSRQYPSSFFTQLRVLFTRRVRITLRDTMLTQLRLGVSLFVGLLIGVLFYNTGGDGAHIFNTFNLMFFSIMFMMFNSYSASFGMCKYNFNNSKTLAAMFFSVCLNMPMLTREHFNKWYSLRSYFFAVDLSEFPVQFISTFLYTALMYFMTAQPYEVDRFGKTLLVMYLMSYVSQGFGYIVGSATRIQDGPVFGPLIIAPFIISSGFFILLKDAPFTYRWLFHISYFKYALEGLMTALFGRDRQRLVCTEDYCHFLSPQRFLEEIGMDHVDYWFNVGVLLIYGLGLRVFSYYFLRIRIQYLKL